VQELSGAAGEILIAIDQISRGASAQAAATQEANAAMEQIEKIAAEAHSSASLARDKADEIASLLEENRNSVAAMAEGLLHAVTDGADALATLEGVEKIGFQIERAVDRIVLVALQTTMLAVSGSVEAARAGDAGRGFALVSADIRKLASDAAESIEGAKDAVRGIQIQIAVVRRELEITVSASTAELAKCRSIVERLDFVKSDVVRIQGGNAAILNAAQSILSATKQVQSGTQQIAAAAQEAGAAAEQAASAARQQSRGAEDLAAAVEEIASLADELQLAGS
jgi:methyl-accepting chemotaxis protein